MSIQLQRSNCESSRNNCNPASIPIIKLTNLIIRELILDANYSEIQTSQARLGGKFARKNIFRASAAHQATHQAAHQAAHQATHQATHQVDSRSSFIFKLETAGNLLCDVCNIHLYHFRINYFNMHSI